MGNNLKDLRVERGWTLDEAADALGLSRGGYIKLERGERQLKLPMIETAARVYGVSTEAVYSDAFTTESTSVPIMGYIGAGSEILPEFEQVPPEGLDTVDLPFSVPDDIVAFRVKGISMLPVYRDGDAVLVWKHQRLATEQYVGEDVACRTIDGKRYLKEMQNGRKRGLFNLYSHNAPLIEDQQIAWVGEIYLIVKAQQIRRIENSQRAAGERREAARRVATAGMKELPLK